MLEYLIAYFFSKGEGCLHCIMMMKNRLDTIKKLYSYIGGIKLLMLSLLTLITSFIAILPIQLLGLMVDALSKNPVTGTGLLWTRLLGHKPEVHLTAFFLAYLLSLLLGALSGHFITMMNQSVMGAIREDAFSWVTSYSELEKRFSRGDLISRITSDVNAVSKILSGPLNGFLPQVFGLFWTLLIFILWDYRLLLVSLITGPFLYLLTKWINHHSYEESKKQRELSGEVTSELTDVLSNFSVIKAASSEDFEIKRFAGVNRRLLQQDKKLISLFTRYWLGINVINAIGLILLLISAYFMITRGLLSIGSLLIVYAYSEKIFKPIISMSRYSKDISEGAASLDRVFSLQPVREEMKRTVNLKKPMIIAENLNLSYGNKNLLKDVSLRIPFGQLIVFRGGSGAGKSTLLKCLGGIEEATSGSVHYRDDHKTYDPKTCRISFSFQDSPVFNRTFTENLHYPTDTLSSSSIDPATMEAFGIDSILKSKSEEDNLGESGFQLSGGEKKRISVLRALLTDHKVVFLDEPTAELDEELSRKLVQAIKEVKGKRTVIISTHDDKFNELADQVITF